MSTSPSAPGRMFPVLIVAALVVVIGGAFLFELLSFDPRTIPADNVSSEEDARALTALPTGDPANGDRLIESLGCFACHRIGAENGIAPSFVGIADRADERKPNMSATAYLYESILHPTAYVVDGFNPAMPQNYPEILSDQDLADLIAYLLTPDAR